MKSAQSNKRVLNQSHDDQNAQSKKVTKEPEFEITVESVMPKVCGNSSKIYKSSVGSIENDSITRILLKMEKNDASKAENQQTQVPFPSNSGFKTLSSAHSLCIPLLLRKPVSNKNSFIEAESVKLQIGAYDAYLKLNSNRSSVETRNTLYPQS